MLDNLDKYDIVLASKSPRRQELLSGLNINFRVENVDCDERYPENLKAEQIPVYIAKLKTEAYKNLMTDNTLLITADTIVWSDGKVFGKPADRQHATEILKALSGKEHQVITGVCVSTVNKQADFFTVTNVKFAELSEDEINYYLDNYKPYDKAGAYGIQEWIGYVGVEGVQGSFYNVMGLPIQRLYQELKIF
ncbi:MAG: Maf-like protein [Paludibacter sp.]|jgi:septum formation protein|nr:Maf-like protein [Paludibacter sp.]